MLGALLFALSIAGPPAQAAAYRSADRAVTLSAPEAWSSSATATDPNAVLELRRRDGASVVLSYAPFPAEGELKERAETWAAELRKRGLSFGAAKKARLGKAATLYYFASGDELHGFFAAPYRAYYVRASGLQAAELETLLGTLELAKSPLQPFEALWPDISLKTVLAENGAFIVEVPATWKVESGPSIGPKQALSVTTGQSSFALTLAKIPADKGQLKASAEVMRQAALDEGAEAGPPTYLVLPNGLSAYVVQLKWPRLKDSGAQWGGFFIYDGKPYAIAALNFNLGALRELLGSLKSPPPDWKAQAEERAARWAQPEPKVTPLPSLPGPKKPRPAPRRPVPLPANLLLLFSAGLALLGAWLYISESQAAAAASAEEEQEAHDAAEGHPHVHEPIPDAGPLSMRRRYLATPTVYDFDGPEGHRFSVESKRPLWLLRWAALFGFVTVWAWSRALELQQGQAIQLAQFVCLLTALLSLPAELLFGRHFKLTDKRGHFLLQAGRAKLGSIEEYRICDHDGHELARLRRSLPGRLFQKRWQVLTPAPEQAVVLSIEGESDPVFRRLTGHLLGLLRDDLKLVLPTGELAGVSLRQGSPLDRALVEYPPETSAYISSDILALALAAVHVLDPDRPHPWPFA